MYEQAELTYCPFRTMQVPIEQLPSRCRSTSNTRSGQSNVPMQQRDSWEPLLDIEQQEISLLTQKKAQRVAPTGTFIRDLTNSIHTKAGGPRCAGKAISPIEDEETVCWRTSTTTASHFGSETNSTAAVAM